MPTDRLAGLKNGQEREACLIAERVLGAEAAPWDVNGRQGAVDAMFLTVPGGRTAAFEVTNLAGGGALDTVDALSSGEYKWPLTGHWFWTINVRFEKDLKKLNRCYPNIIRICEQGGVTSLNYQLGWSPSDHPDIRWLVQESSCEMIGEPACPPASMAKPEAMVVLTADGGCNDDSMTGFAAALGAAFDGAPHMARHFRKLKNADADERHLFIPLHGTALPFSIFTVLQFDDPLPPEPPPIPDYVTHLWLAPDSSKRVLIWTRPGGWRNFFPYEMTPAIKPATVDALLLLDPVRAVQQRQRETTRGHANPGSARTNLSFNHPEAGNHRHRSHRTRLDDEERQALQADGLDPDDPAANAAIGPTKCRDSVCEEAFLLVVEFLVGQEP